MFLRERDLKKLLRLISAQKSVQVNAELEKHARVTLRHSTAGDTEERGGHLLVHALALGSAGGVMMM